MAKGKQTHAALYALRARQSYYDCSTAIRQGLFGAGQVCNEFPWRQGG